MGWGKAKEKEINTPIYIGKIHIQIIYLDKIYKKKASFFYIYSKTHIFLGKCLISIYIRKTYTTIWAKYKRKKKCIDKKVLFLLQGKHYIYRLGQNTKEKRGFFYI